MIGEILDLEEERWLPARVTAGNAFFRSLFIPDGLQISEEAIFRHIDLLLGKKMKLFWNFKLNLFHLCISLRLRILNPKSPEAQMFPHAGSQQARQQSAPPSILRL